MGVAVNCHLIRVFWGFCFVLCCNFKILDIVQCSEIGTRSKQNHSPRNVSRRLKILFFF